MNFNGLINWMAARIGVTLGDPAGIGPEIVAKALEGLNINEAEIFLIGNLDNFRMVKEAVRLPERVFSSLHFVDIESTPIPMGEVSAAGGSVALRSIETAVRMTLNGELTGICTAPISKEAIILAGSRYKDHTEMLGALTHTRDVSTVFETGKLRIIFLSKHVSMKAALSLVTRDHVYEHIMLADVALKALGIEDGKIAVAALNPHGGENGLFGREELDEIGPAIKLAENKVRVSGPFPADSVFHRASKGEFDIVLSLYHDQGHIAAKMYDFDRTVSMNIGLPFLRTSVDHGTAFDIAGKWIASEVSMLEAIRKVIKYSESYRNFLESSGMSR